MVSPYLLRRRRSLEEAAADRTTWVLTHEVHAPERWLMLTQLHRMAALDAATEAQPGEAASAGLR